MNNRLAKFKDLVPSTLPFVEGKMDGHKERKNYSIVGPGVAEDSKQFVKICLLYTSPSPRDDCPSRMPSSA